MGFKKATQLFFTIIAGCLVGTQWMPIVATFVQTSLAMFMASIPN